MGPSSAVPGDGKWQLQYGPPVEHGRVGVSRLLTLAHATRSEAARAARSEAARVARSRPADQQPGKAAVAHVLTRSHRSAHIPGAPGTPRPCSPDLTAALTFLPRPVRRARAHREPNGSERLTSAGCFWSASSWRGTQYKQAELITA